MNSIKYFFSFVVLFLYSNTLFPQTSNYDSLLNVLDTIADNQKAKVYNEIYRLESKKLPPDTLRYYLNKALRLAKKYSNEYQTALTYRNTGMNYVHMEKYQKSLENYAQSQKIFKKIKRFDKLISIYFETGDVYWRMRNTEKNIFYYEKALYLIDSLIKQDNSNSSKLYKKQLTGLHVLSLMYTKLAKYNKVAELHLKALEISEKNNYTKGIISANTDLGALYRKLNDFDKAQYYLEKALKLELKNQPPDSTSLASIYLKLGLNYRGQKDYKNALKFINKTLTYEKTPVTKNDFYNSMLIFNSLALTYMDKKEYSLALINYLKALDFAKKSSSPYLISAAIINVGSVYELQKQYKKAIKQYEKGLEIAEKNNFLKWQMEAYIGLKNCYKHLGSFKEALYYLQDYIVINDSLKIEESKQKLAELETKYETEKKQKQIELLNKENEINELKLNRNKNILIITFIILFLLLSTTFVYFRYLKQKTKTKELLFEKQLLSTVISTEDKERKRFASDLHDGLGPLLSSIKLYLSGLKDIDEEERNKMIDYSIELIDESIKSVRTISNNILPVELSNKGLVTSIQRFCDKIQHSKQIEINIKDDTGEKRLDPSTELILYRVIQELINNSIKHAEAKNIDINFHFDNKKFILKFQDNGKGFDIEKQKSESKGLGLKNIFDKVFSLQGEIKFNSKIGEGTTVVISLDI